MKKILSLFLAMVLVLGSVSQADAATGVKLKSYIRLYSKNYTDFHTRLSNNGNYKVTIKKNKVCEITEVFEAPDDWDVDDVTDFGWYINNYFKYFKSASVKVYAAPDNLDFTKCSVKLSKINEPNVDLCYTNGLGITTTDVSKFRFTKQLRVKIILTPKKPKF